MGNFIDNMPIVQITKSILGVNPPPAPMTGIPLENQNPIIFLPRPGVSRGNMDQEPPRNNTNTNPNPIKAIDQDTLIYIVGGAVILIILLKK